MDDLHLKKQKLEEYLKSLGKVAVAFSSGVDSTFLLKVCKDVLGENAIAITIKTCSVPERELEESAVFCEKEGIRQMIIELDQMAIEGFEDNPPDRCYICKKALFSNMMNVAAECGFDHVAEGSNMDDMGDYRPGMKAISELNVLSPLREAGLTKADIRELSRELGLPTWNKPSFACLATRFVYGEKITREKLRMIEMAEQRLMDMGFSQFRVRIHGNLARIEVDPSEFGKIMSSDTASSLNEYLQELGFKYVTLDLGGYVTGSMNKVLNL
jgi:uncharacterized protein